MTIDEFVCYSKVLHRLTADFVRSVPEDKWDFTPDPPGKSGRAPVPHRIGDGFGPFCKQLRHVVCVRGVYNAALATGKVDWPRKHEHYCGPLTREALMAALDDKQRQLLATLETVDINAPMGWNPFHLCPFHLGVRATRGDPSRSVEYLCLAGRVRHAAQLARVMGLVKIDRIRSFVLQLMPMLMGKRRRRSKQTSMRAATQRGFMTTVGETSPLHLQTPPRLQSLGGLLKISGQTV